MQGYILKKVLIITYYWPPSGGSGVQRWLKFAKYLPQFGWEPIIYTPENPQANAKDPALLKDVAPGTTVLKTKIWEPYGLYKALFGGKKRKYNPSTVGKKQTENTSAAPIKANLIGSTDTSFKHRLSLFIRGNLFIPDPRFLWIRPSVKYLIRYLKEHPADAIVSTGPPHSMHLIARKVARQTGIKWVADFRDPWTEMFFFKHLRLSRYAYHRHRTLEQKVLDSADEILVVSEKMRRDFERRTQTPVTVITNGFDPDDFTQPAKSTEGTVCTTMLPRQDATPETDREAPRFTLTHTGIFVDNGNPDYLWEVLGEKAAAEPDFKTSLEIRLMGQVDGSVLSGIEKAGLSGCLVNMGYVSHTEVTGWQQQASVLLLPLRKEPEAAAILTGKFFEYLAAGAPILAFGPADGDLAKALQETGSGTIVDFEDRPGTKREIDRLYREFLQQPITKSTSGEKEPGRLPGKTTGYSGGINPKAYRYSRPYLTEQLSGILNNL